MEDGIHIDDAKFKLEIDRFILERKKLDWEKDKHTRELLAARYRYLSQENIDYLKILIQITIAYFTLSGILVSHYLGNGNEAIKLALWIPFSLGLTLGFLFYWSVEGTIYVDQEFNRICDISYGYSPIHKEWIQEWQNMSNSLEPSDEFLEEWNITYSKVVSLSTPLRASLYLFGFSLAMTGVLCFWLITESVQITVLVGLIVAVTLLLIRLEHKFKLIEKPFKFFKKNNDGIE